MKTRATILILALSSLAFGATAWTYRQNVKVAGKTMLGTQVETNLITRSLYVTTSFKFAEASIVCEDSWAVALAGAVVNDPCFVGLLDTTTLTATDGGPSISHFSCYVSAADAVKVRHCPAGTATNVKDAGFTIRLISGL